MYYFAYGSNLSTERLTARIARVSVVGRGVLRDHRLLFHKRGRDGSGKCDALNTGSPADVVHGVIYRIGAEQRAQLDRFEGLGHGYVAKSVDIATDGGATLSAFTYIATAIDAGLRPFDWYRTHVIHGARQHELPAAYVAALETTPTWPDPDPDRPRRELSVYPDGPRLTR